MSIEKFIRGKRDDAHHDGRYSNVKRELAAEVDADIGEQLIFSLSAIRHLPKDSEIYKYHKGICDFWLEPCDDTDEEPS